MCQMQLCSAAATSLCALYRPNVHHLQSHFSLRTPQKPNESLLVHKAQSSPAGLCSGRSPFKDTRHHASSQQTATVTPTTCSKGRQLQPGMKEAGSRWQSNPLAAYILCCTPPRDVQAPYEQRGGFPFIYSTKIDITIQVHPLETPTCNPFQHPCSERGNRNKVVIQPRKYGWPSQRS